MAIRFQWCRSLSAAEFPATAYEELRTQVVDATPFNTLAWLQAAEFALAPDQQLHVLLGWQDQTLCLCLPLLLLPPPPPGSTPRPSTSTSARNAPLSAPEFTVSTMGPPAP